MRYLILVTCSFLVIACSEEGDKSQPLCGPDSNTESCLSQHKAQLSQCYSDICSQQTSLSKKGFEKIAQKRERYLPESELYQGVEKAVHNKIEYYQKISKRLFDSYLHFSEKEKISLSDKQKAAVNRHFFMSFYKKAFKLENPFNDLMLTNLAGVSPSYVPSSKVMNKLSLSPEDQEWVKNILKVSSFKGFPRSMIARYHGTSYIMEEYPDRPLDEAIQQAASECQQTHKVIKRKLGIPFPIPHINRAEICRRILKNSRSIINMNLFTQEVQNAKKLQPFFKDELDDIWLAREVDPKKILTSLNQDAILAVIKAYNTVDLQKDKNIRALVQKSIDTCHSVIGDAYETAPTKKQRREAQRAIEEVKTITKEKFYFANLPMKNFFEAKVNDIQFKFPLFGVDYSRDVLNIFDTWLKDLKSIDNIRNRRSLLTALLIYGVSSHGTPAVKKDTPPKNVQGIVPLPHVVGLCSHFASPVYGDHHYQSTGHIYVSWNNLKHLDIGLGVITHEIGHAVSTILRGMKSKWPGSYYGGLAEQNPIWERRACIDRFHNDKPHAILEENSYTEEDWADYFATTILSDYKGDIQTKNYLCPVVENMDLLKEDGATHASRVFRAIHVHKTRTGQMPASCQAAMQRKKMPSCF